MHCSHIYKSHLTSNGASLYQDCGRFLKIILFMCICTPKMGPVGLILVIHIGLHQTLNLGVLIGICLRIDLFEDRVLISNLSIPNHSL